jgi:hypothetical protein
MFNKDGEGQMELLNGDKLHEMMDKIITYVYIMLETWLHHLNIG